MSVELRHLLGLWRRSLLRLPDGSSDTTTTVRWLQWPSMYVDLRQGANQPEFAGARALSELSARDCAWLATQQGFAGVLSFDGRWFEWQRAIDFQPKSVQADAGALHWERDVLIEHGRDVDYLEHWHREADREPNACSLSLRAVDSLAESVLVRVGPHFMWARSRTGMVPSSGRKLSDCVADAGTLEQARALIDCEVSFGEVRLGGFHITASTLPYRIGDTLEPRRRLDLTTTLDRAYDGASVQRCWRVHASEGPCEGLC